MNRLRLLGFKSFVDPTDLIIEQGLTGVVGPNGCGKSNLLEALRWVMGETSHKSMRAAAMDDVIFSGTNSRPARNWAEVTIFLDNSSRSAPAEFNDVDTIEITRRIEREAGSAYASTAAMRAPATSSCCSRTRRPARAHQRSFARGQIAEIVNAKPEQRRRVLEDAAGVAGLHSRRHEAELRLKAAEGNLARLGDIIGQLSSQLDSPQAAGAAGQALQGTVGRDSPHRGAAAASLVDRGAGAGRCRRGRAARRSYIAGSCNAGRSRRHTRGSGVVGEPPPLRDEEAVRAAVLARVKIEQTNFEAEARRSADRLRELVARNAQLAADLLREQALVADANEALARLTAEHEALSLIDNDTDGQDAAALDRLDASEAKLAAAEQALTKLTQQAFETSAKRKSLESSLSTAREQIAKFTRQIAGLDAQLRDIAGKAPDAQSLTRLQQTAKDLAAQLTQIEGQTVEAESNIRKAALVAKAKRRRGDGREPRGGRSAHRAVDAGEAAGARARRRHSADRRQAEGGEGLRGRARRGAGATISTRRCRPSIRCTGAASIRPPMTPGCRKAPSRCSTASRGHRS